MLRSSSSRERGSALIEAVVIGSFVFIVVVAAVGAAINVTLSGGAAQDRARTATVHASRHAGSEAAETMASGRWGTVEVTRVEGAIRVVIAGDVVVPHPGGLSRRPVMAMAEMPLAPYRSDRG